MQLSPQTNMNIPIFFFFPFLPLFFVTNELLMLFFISSICYTPLPSTNMSTIVPSGLPSNTVVNIFTSISFSSINLCISVSSVACQWRWAFPTWSSKLSYECFISSAFITIVVSSHAASSIHNWILCFSVDYHFLQVSYLSTHICEKLQKYDISRYPTHLWPVVSVWVSFVSKVGLLRLCVVIG